MKTIKEDLENLPIGRRVYAHKLGTYLDNKSVEKILSLIAERLPKERDVNTISSAHDLYSGKPAPYAEGYRNGFNIAQRMILNEVLALLGKRECPACKDNIPAYQTKVGDTHLLCSKHKAELDNKLESILEGN